MNHSLLSVVYTAVIKAHWRRLETDLAEWALLRAGRRIPARMAMMVITTSNSIKVKAEPPGGNPREWRGERHFFINFGGWATT